MEDTDDTKDEFPIIDTGPAPEKNAPTDADPDEGELTPEMASLTDDLIGALKSVYDPEIPVDVYELGLIYRVDVSDARDVTVDMTLTAPGCGMGQVLVDDVTYAVKNVPGVVETDVDLVFDPAWNPDLMTEAAKLELGLM